MRRREGGYKLPPVLERVPNFEFNSDAKHDRTPRTLTFTCSYDVYIIRRDFEKGLYVSAIVAINNAQRQRQILNQIQTTAVQSQRALSIARQQTAAKDRERRIMQLTIDEIGHIEGDVNLYKGVGKMCVLRLLCAQLFDTDVT